MQISVGFISLKKSFITSILRNSCDLELKLKDRELLITAALPRKPVAVSSGSFSMR